MFYQRLHDGIMHYGAEWYQLTIIARRINAVRQKDHEYFFNRIYPDGRSRKSRVTEGVG